MENIVLIKSKQFAIRMVKLYRYLNDEKKEFVLSKQMLRSGTSIGANIVEAEHGISKKDFLAKMYKYSFLTKSNCNINNRHAL